MFKHGGCYLFDDTTTYHDLAKLLADGAEIKTTPLTEKFSDQDYLQHREEHHWPLFAIDTNEGMQVFTPEPDLSPRAGWIIIGISTDLTLN